MDRQIGRLLAALPATAGARSWPRSAITARCWASTARRSTASSCIGPAWTVPLILAGPRRAAGRRVRTGPVGTRALPATLLQLLGLAEDGGALRLRRCPASALQTGAKPAGPSTARPAARHRVRMEPAARALIRDGGAFIERSAARAVRPASRIRPRRGTSCAKRPDEAARLAPSAGGRAGAAAPAPAVGSRPGARGRAAQPGLSLGRRARPRRAPAASTPRTASPCWPSSSRRNGGCARATPRRRSRGSRAWSGAAPATSPSSCGWGERSRRRAGGGGDSHSDARRPALAPPGLPAPAPGRRLRRAGSGGRGPGGVPRDAPAQPALRPGLVGPGGDRRGAPRAGRGAQDPGGVRSRRDAQRDAAEPAGRARARLGDAAVARRHALEAERLGAPPPASTPRCRCGETVGCRRRRAYA